MGVCMFKECLYECIGTLFLMCSVALYSATLPHCRVLHYHFTILLHYHTATPPHHTTPSRKACMHEESVYECMYEECVYECIGTCASSLRVEQRGCGHACW